MRRAGSKRRARLYVLARGVKDWRTDTMYGDTTKRELDRAVRETQTALRTWRAVIKNLRADGVPGNVVSAVSRQVDHMEDLLDTHRYLSGY